MLSQADRAMFYAKDQGRNNAQFFCDMAGKGFGKREVYIQNRLAAAINGKKILTWFQPLVDAKSRQIIGVEALARWEDAEYGWISPVTFIPMAENMGLIMELSQQVWEEALFQGRRWREMGHALKIAINISRRQLFAPGFVQLLSEAVSKYQLPAAAVVLEVTESIANIDTEQTGKRLKELADLGFTLSIDDFGTGYSSLSQLHSMPIREVKIDISFVRRVREVQGGELIQAIQHMAEAFNLHSVAEGVEDEATAQLLQHFGVDYLQGYLFGKPMTAEAMDVLLGSSGASDGSIQ
jgi:EAL domain-containing protein (putative c-di-GMP-specific phosphodiesterase class I)